MDYNDVTDTLEREGVEKFSAAFDELLQTLAREARLARRRLRRRGALSAACAGIERGPARQQ